MSNSLINQAFKIANNENRPALLTYTVAGDNTKKKSLDILKSISKYADICELGFPHNAPIADGNQIQTSAYRAIKNGIKINDVFSIVSKFKKIKKKTPIILMGYYNMILHYGVKNFVTNCVKNGVDGLIVVDLQPEEDEELIENLKNSNIDLIRLITPTTNEERLKLILQNASGFLYFVSVTGITGQKSANLIELEKSIRKIKNFTDLPVVPGFGIKNATDVKNICKISDGAVVGSSIIKIIEDNLADKKEMIRKIDLFTKDLKEATNI